MIQEFKLKNFFSIKEELVLDLRPATIHSEKARALNENLINESGRSQSEIHCSL